MKNDKKFFSYALLTLFIIIILIFSVSIIISIRNSLVVDDNLNTSSTSIPEGSACNFDAQSECSTGICCGCGLCGGRNYTCNQICNAGGIPTDPEPVPDPNAPKKCPNRSATDLKCRDKEEGTFIPSDFGDGCRCVFDYTDLDCICDTSDTRLNNGELCMEGSDCKSNYCEPTTSTCADIPKNDGESCSDNIQCKSKICLEGKCITYNKAIGDKCYYPVECSSGNCVRIPTGEYSVCVADSSLKGPGEPCVFNEECMENLCLPDGTGANYCAVLNLPNGSICFNDTVCASGLCAGSGASRTCEQPGTRGEGSECSRNEQCSNGRCQIVEGAGSFCLSENPGGNSSIPPQEDTPGLGERTVDPAKLDCEGLPSGFVREDLNCTCNSQGFCIGTNTGQENEGCISNSSCSNGLVCLNNVCSIPQENQPLNNDQEEVEEPLNNIQINSPVICTINTLTTTLNNTKLDLINLIFTLKKASEESSCSISRNI